MHKRDYELIASALRASKPTYEIGESFWEVNQPTFSWRRQQWHKTLSALADMLQIDNPKFDRDKFLLAAGYPPET